MIQVDGGSEFLAGFEQRCLARRIALYILSPRSSRLKGRVEWLNGRVGRGFWECYVGDLDLPTLQQELQDWETQYNDTRPRRRSGTGPPEAARCPHPLRCIELEQLLDRNARNLPDDRCITISSLPDLVRALDESGVGSRRLVTGNQTCNRGITT